MTKITSAQRISAGLIGLRAFGLVPAERALKPGRRRQIASAVGLRHWLRLQTRVNRGQTLRDPHKSIPGSALDGAPHHVEHAPAFPGALGHRNLRNCANTPGLNATMKGLSSP